MNHLETRSLHARTSKVTAEDKVKRLQQWVRLRKQGVFGELLQRRTHMNLVTVRRWAAEVNFDLEGLA